jgi:hypothetical protein
MTANPKNPAQTLRDMGFQTYFFHSQSGVREEPYRKLSAKDKRARRFTLCVAFEEVTYEAWNESKLVEVFLSITQAPHCQFNRRLGRIVTAGRILKSIQLDSLPSLEEDISSREQLNMTSKNTISIRTPFWRVVDYARLLTTQYSAKDFESEEEFLTFFPGITILDNPTRYWVDKDRDSSKLEETHISSARSNRL